MMSLHIHASKSLKLAYDLFKKKKKEYFICSEYLINTCGMNKWHAALHALYQKKTSNHALAHPLQLRKSPKW